MGNRKLENNETILVVDDDPSIRLVLSAGLKQEGYQVISVADGSDGLRELKAGLKPALIILDQDMPVMNGDELLKEKTVDPNLAPIPVVVISATTDRSTPLGAAAFISKPFNFDTLLALIKRYTGPK